MDLTTTIAGIRLKNPVMPAAGPLTGDAEKILFLADTVGGMVTKTISTTAANVQRPCIWGSTEGVLNNELWSELAPEIWIDEILPKVKKDIKIPLIVSAGYSAEDMKKLIPLLEPYADAFEISTHYVGTDMGPISKTVETIRKSTRKPFFMKISPHMPDPAGFAKMVRECGGNGIAAINSLGPSMRIDIAKREPFAGNREGHAWLSGPPVKAVALAIVDIVKQAAPELDVIGVGGIRTAEDVIEFLLAGASAVQLLSCALIYGKDIFQKIVDALPGALERNGYRSATDAAKAGIQIQPIRHEPRHPAIDREKCNRCRLCEKVCPYFALTFDGEIKTHPEKCFGCGLCESRCPKDAISGVIG
jgi:dihydroorotate dehydrogenase subfamily 1